MKHIVIVLVIISLVALVSYRLGGSSAQTPMKEHMKVLDDGVTIMMMGRTYHPAVLHVAPGSTIKVLNHEPISFSLMSDDHKSFQTPFIDSRGEDIFITPSEPGSYPFHLHPQGSDDVISGGMLIVEN